MLIHRLRLARMRSFTVLDWSPRPGINLITGANGAGKSTVLEAVHLMAHGRSFRGRVRDGLIRDGEDALEVVLDWQIHAPAGQTRRAGLRHGGGDWEARLDGQPVRQLGDLCAALAVTTFEPGSHALVSGAAETRRRYLDWGMFHVEPEFLALWRRYRRALLQRNALLKRGARPQDLDAWEHELAGAGEALTLQRQTYVAALQRCVQQTLDALMPQAGQGELLLRPGWRRDELPLADALLLSRERDMAAGFTSVGPHRADLQPLLAALPDRSRLSRGQAKSLALVLLLAQARHLQQLRGDMPVVALDDLASELDRDHQGRVLAWLGAFGAQVLITGTERLAILDSIDTPVTMFHVEHGSLVQR